jgi:multidrug resistance efflux pump
VIELIIGTYGLICWLLFKKFRVIPTNAYTVSSAIMIGVAFLALLAVTLMKYHPASSDARLYTFTTPIVPQVAGRVVEVPVTANVPLREGEVLFQIDAQPYWYEVNRLEALLASANAGLGQLEKRLSAAEAATDQARAELLVSESEYDREARQELEQARFAADQVRAQVTLAGADYDRYRELYDKGTVPRQKFEQVQEQLQRLQAQLKQAESTIRQAEEAVAGGGDRLQAVRDRQRQAEAREEEIRIELESESGGANPAVQQVVAELGAARWRLDEATVRAPADGYVTQLTLRPGQMATTLPLVPVMVFVHDEQPGLIASFPQNVIADLKLGLEAELAFKAYPGKIFPATVSHLLPATAEGQLTPGGQLRAATPATSPGRILVVFDYGDDVASLGLPGGAQATVAVYTEHLHALSLVRKIVLRIKSWENYIFLP